MTRGRGRVTEETLYPYVKQIFEEHGASIVTTIKYLTVPDFVASWLGEQWIVSIKIGDPTQPRLLKSAFTQYVGHMRDTGIKYGMIIFYPEKTRRLRPVDEEIRRFVRTEPVYVIVLNPQTELREPLPNVLDEIEKILREKIPVLFRLETIVKLLRAQIEELMSRMEITEQQILRIISSPELFFGINPIEKDEQRKRQLLIKASTFLAAYIFLSQVLFLRLYCEEKPTLLEGIDIGKITKQEVSTLFEKIKDINYRPIFDLNVLTIIPEELVQNTFKLLFGIQIKGIRYELPGRLFHELMPKEIRKLLAAFYTRPVAAAILAQLTIDDPNATILDPACGSGTILVMAYRRKAELWKEKNLMGSPHKLFCEKHIYGCDIMPFAVHLTNANLAAMEPLTTIDLTQITLEDSLKLAPRQPVKPGFLTLMEFLPEDTRKEGVKVNVFKRTGEVTEIMLEPVDVVLMNPPFTKVERGVRDYVDVSRFEDSVGSEVGLWGSFVALADVFLKDGGVFGAVLPINLLRGRESKKVREIIFKTWLPLYIIKASKNYGFSEYAEYRDILVIAKKIREKPKEHVVKFCIVKKDLNDLTDEDVKWLTDQIKRVQNLRSELLDIDSKPLTEVLKHFDNLMPFISGPSLEAKDALQTVINEAERIFSPFPPNYFIEGYGPRPKGSSSFMFVTRPVGEGRLKEAFLILERDLPDSITARTPVGVRRFSFSKRHFLPSLRTPVDLNKLDVTCLHDYVAKEPYENMEEVMRLANFEDKLPSDYWSNYIKIEFRRSTAKTAIVRRINPFSPNQKLIAFYSQKPLVLANLFHIINEQDEDVAKAVIVILNSIFFLTYFFNLKEETTGRYTELRHYDLYDMRLYPPEKCVKQLVEIYEKYKDVEFPALREQLDIYFDIRYNRFWGMERRGQETLVEPPPVTPHQLRLEFDMDVVKAVGANLSKEDLLKAYEAIIWDMIITRGLRRD